MCPILMNKQTLPKNPLIYLKLWRSKDRSLFFFFAGESSGLVHYPGPNCMSWGYPGIAWLWCVASSLARRRCVFWFCARLNDRTRIYDGQNSTIRICCLICLRGTSWRLMYLRMLLSFANLRNSQDTQNTNQIVTQPCGCFFNSFRLSSCCKDPKIYRTKVYTILYNVYRCVFDKN